MTATAEATKQTLEQELQQQALTVSTSAGSLEISDQSTYDKACEFLTKTLKPVAAKIEAYFDPDIKAAHQLHKSLNDKKRVLLDPILKAEAIVKRSIGTWTAEQERLRQEAQRKAEDERRRQEEEAKLSTAVQAEELGASEEETSAILDAPTYAAPAVAAPTFQRAAGVSVKGNWKGSCDDVQKLCEFIAKNPKYINLVEPNLPAINKLAKALESSFDIPGCRAYRDAVVAARSK
jgi:hypothetical protein